MSIQVNAITNTTYQNNQNIRSVDLNYKPWVNNSMSLAFINCRNLQSVNNINNNITSMQAAFLKCISLVNAPVIPNSVTNMCQTFLECINLINAPTIPNSVTDLQGTFGGCEKLVNAPIIPNSVVNMVGTFGKHAGGLETECVSLVNAPMIPNSVINMQSTFSYCSNLVNAPNIPNSVIDTAQTFLNCVSLVTAPDIPNSVTHMYGTFRNCVNLIGDIHIYSNQISNAMMCFNGTSLTKNVYIPFTYDNGVNGVNTATYNAFTKAGYSTTTRKDGTLLFDINNPEPVVNEYEYTVLSSGKADLTKYIGSGGAIVTPTIIG